MNTNTNIKIVAFSELISDKEGNKILALKYLRIIEESEASKHCDYLNFETKVLDDTYATIEEAVTAATDYAAGVEAWGESVYSNGVVRAKFIPYFDADFIWTYYDNFVKHWFEFGEGKSTIEDYVIEAINDVYPYDGFYPEGALDGTGRTPSDFAVGLDDVIDRFREEINRVNSERSES